MKNEQEITTLYRTLRLVAINELITEYAYKNRARIVQKLLELKHAEEQKLLSNKPLQLQKEQENTSPKGLPLGAISHHNNGGILE